MKNTVLENWTLLLLDRTFPPAKRAKSLRKQLYASTINHFKQFQLFILVAFNILLLLLSFKKENCSAQPKMTVTAYTWNVK